MVKAHKDGLLIRVSGGQIQGARDYQEDNYRVLDLDVDAIVDDNMEHYDHALLVLTDGMGGHNGGAQASHVAAAKFANAFESREDNIMPRQALLDALHAANNAVMVAVDKDPSLSGMGTTIVAAYISNNELYWCSVGDSLLYIFRNGALLRLNADHSMVPLIEKMVELGELTAEQGRNDPRRNALRAAIDGNDLDLIDVSSEPYYLQKNDVLILASDGIDTLSDDEITSILADNEHSSISKKLKKILRAVQDYDYPDQDNTTVILYDAHDRLGPSCDGEDSKASYKVEDTILRQRSSQYDSEVGVNEVQDSNSIDGRPAKKGRPTFTWLRVAKACLILTVVIVAMIVAMIVAGKINLDVTRTAPDMSIGEVVDDSEVTESLLNESSVLDGDSSLEEPPSRSKVEDISDSAEPSINIEREVDPDNE